ncbi:hypothetical protein ASPCAL11889 [Aspergillus calidoustus]|jgi:hypothetical protein|uniref:Uncharacterized protein n=1 Tax=Aspergillus calidoustus TaxID=454130 RepID=A0A0U5GDM7_ASPCI|nr:hypothetical protein ASPCAL11889 [Aspergillus calidoustus]
MSIIYSTTPLPTNTQSTGLATIGPKKHLKLTRGLITSSLEFPRMVMVKPAAAGDESRFKLATHDDLMTYRRNVDTNGRLPARGDPDRVGFWVDGRGMLMLGMGTVVAAGERVVVAFVV